MTKSSDVSFSAQELSGPRIAHDTIARESWLHAACTRQAGGETGASLIPKLSWERSISYLSPVGITNQISEQNDTNLYPILEKKRIENHTCGPQIFYLDLLDL